MQLQPQRRPLPSSHLLLQTLEHFVFLLVSLPRVKLGQLPMPQLQPVPKLMPMPMLLLEPKPQLGLAIIIIELHLLGPQLTLIDQLEVESRQQQLQVGQQ